MSEILRYTRTKPCGGIYGFATEHSAGCDLMSSESYIIEPQATVLISTGVKLAIPLNHYGMIASRSGLGVNHGIVVAQGVGIIDADYRGEVMVPLYNQSDETFYVSSDDRVAQLIICPYANVIQHHQGWLDETERGEGGFGSTG